MQAFSLAVNTGRKDRETGKWEDDTTWHRIVAFGPLAEHVLASVHVGDLVTVTARPHNADYTIPGGDEEVIASGVQPTDDRDYQARPSRLVQRTAWWADDVSVSLVFTTAEVTRVKSEQQRRERVLAVA